MRHDWEYEVIVSTNEDPLAYDGRFVRQSYAYKVVSRKLEEYKGTGASVHLYNRYTGTHDWYIA